MSEKSGVRDFTFEDWVNDNDGMYMVYYEAIDDTIPVGKSGYFPDALHKKGVISETEYSKIKKAQKEAYDIVFDHHSEKSLAEFRKDLETSPDKETYLIQRKKNIERFFDQADQQIVEKVAAGKWDSYRIDNITYKKIINQVKKGEAPSPLKGLKPEFLAVFGPHPTPDMAVKGKDYQTEIDEHFKLALLFKEYQEIKKLLENENDQLSNLVKEFAHDFSNSPRVKYSAQAIRTYIRIWEDKRNLPDFRNKAKTEAIQNCDELSSVRDGTFFNWEEKWEKFKESRTGK